jgi:hypothetical protein
MSELNFEYYSSVQETEVEWLWYPYIPYGKLTLLQGDPGDGKSTFILNVIALLTTGRPMPDGYQPGGRQTVIYQCREDGAADTIKPRLIAAGADCDRVAFIVDERSELTLDDSRIEDTIKKTGARLLVLDPLQSFVQDGDYNNAGRMRSLLGGLTAIAERQKCAIVLVGHMNKSQSGKSLYRGLGSIDIQAIVRSVLMVERDADNPGVRYMFPVKSSLAAEGDARAFKFERRHGFVWIGPCEHGYEEMETEPIRESKTEKAERILRNMLSEDMPVSLVMEAMAEAGISDRTANTIKKQMGIESYKIKNKWYWSLPEGDCVTKETEADDE